MGAAAPLQEAGAVALRLPASFYADLLAGYAERRAVLCAGLEAAGFRVYRPAGAYYVMTDIADLGGSDDVAFVRAMIERVGVPAVPGSSFYADRACGRTQVRFAFPKQRATLEAAVRRLAGLPIKQPARRQSSPDGWPCGARPAWRPPTERLMRRGVSPGW